MRADSPTSRVHLASALISSHVLKSWFPSAATSPVNTSAHRDTQDGGPRRLLTLDSRGERTTTMQRVCGHANSPYTNNRSCVGSSYDKTFMNHPDLVATSRQLTEDKSSSPRLPAGSILAQPRGCIMMRSRDIGELSWSISTNDVEAHRLWRLPVPSRCPDLVYAPNEPPRACQLHLGHAFLADNNSREMPRNGNIALCTQESS